MRKKGDESGKKTEKRRINLVPVLMGTGIAFGMSLLLVLCVAALIWSGTLSATTPNIVLCFCMGLCAFVGGRFAIGRGGDPMLAGILTGGVLALVLIIVCLVSVGGIPLHGQFLATILLTLAGGTLSGLFGGSKKRRKKKKK